MGPPNDYTQGWGCCLGKLILAPCTSWRPFWAFLFCHSKPRDCRVTASVRTRSLLLDSSYRGWPCSWISCLCWFRSLASLSSTAASYFSAFQPNFVQWNPIIFIGRLTKISGDWPNLLDWLCWQNYLKSWYLLSSSPTLQWVRRWIWLKQIGSSLLHCSHSAWGLC